MEFKLTRGRGLTNPNLSFLYVYLDGAINNVFMDTTEGMKEAKYYIDNYGKDEREAEEVILTKTIER